MQLQRTFKGDPKLFKCRRALLYSLCVSICAVGSAIAGQVLQEEVKADTIPLRFYIVTKESNMIDTKEAVGRRIEFTNKIFLNAAVKLQFSLSSITPLTDSPLDLLRQLDRNELVKKIQVSDKAIHVFVVNSISDTDDHTSTIAGVHWKYSGNQKEFLGQHFIILSARDSNPDTLAHEVGHWFGLKHEPTPENLMFSGPRENQALLLRQVKTILDFKKIAINRGEIEASDVKRRYENLKK